MRLGELSRTDVAPPANFRSVPKPPNRKKKYYIDKFCAKPENPLMFALTMSPIFFLYQGARGNEFPRTHPRPRPPHTQQNKSRFRGPCFSCFPNSSLFCRGLFPWRFWPCFQPFRRRTRSCSFHRPRFFGRSMSKWFPSRLYSLCRTCGSSG